MYTQCTLIKSVGSGYLKLVTFIPIEYAKLNKNLSLKKDDGSYEDGWVVKEIGQSIAEERINKLHEFHTSFKKKEVAGRKSYKD